MSKNKAGGTSKNLNDSPGQRLGVKRYGGEVVGAGEVLVRQRGSSKVAGPGTDYGRDYTIYATKPGTVSYRSIKVKRFTGKSAPRTEVSVV
ncbi:TPA: 50S ribosomal protein L27 [Candidatus Saccharibacteria bacterium]|nr:50S ribosomal protein L27 [Candidatus Saccharibacteria bacterium]HIO87548.1 50S ribosomal protein L27 [Candidatus Saccharibacteria bacterium]